jgi:hypothetical protein
LAISDLEATHAEIGSAHHGILDDENPGFKDWYESGYRQALAFVPRVGDYETMLSAVRFYTTGFKDGHQATPMTLVASSTKSRQRSPDSRQPL